MIRYIVYFFVYLYMRKQFIDTLLNVGFKLQRDGNLIRSRVKRSTSLTRSVIYFNDEVEIIIKSYRNINTIEFEYQIMYLSTGAKTDWLTIYHDSQDDLNEICDLIKKEFSPKHRDNLLNDLLND